MFPTCLPPRLQTKTVKAFLVQFECAEETRGLFNDERLREALHSVSASLARSQFTGPIPAVTVILDPQQALLPL